MKAKIKIEKEVEIKYLQVSADITHWEDATVDGIEDADGDRIPCRGGDSWRPIINIDTGIITNWVKGVTADIHYKVCDAGVYELLDENGEVLVTKEGYVPDIMCPEDYGYGDYIIMKVDENGQIKNWTPEIDDFLEDD